jgi:hypothetical protein
VVCIFAPVNNVTLYGHFWLTAFQLLALATAPPAQTGVRTEIPAATARTLASLTPIAVVILTSLGFLTAQLESFVVVASSRHAVFVSWIVVILPMVIIRSMVISMWRSRSLGVFSSLPSSFRSWTIFLRIMRTPSESTWLQLLVIPCWPPLVLIFLCLFIRMWFLLVFRSAVTSSVPNWRGDTGT